MHSSDNIAAETEFDVCFLGWGGIVSGVDGSGGVGIVGIGSDMVGSDMFGSGNEWAWQWR